MLFNQTHRLNFLTNSFVEIDSDLFVHISTCILIDENTNFCLKLSTIMIINI
jgi:hypothetical protein